jgi:hypothetical protein
VKIDLKGDAVIRFVNEALQVRPVKHSIAYFKRLVIALNPNTVRSFAAEKQIADSQATDEMPSLDAALVAFQAYQEKGSEGLLEVIMKNEREAEQKRKFQELASEDIPLLQSMKMRHNKPLLAWCPAGNWLTKQLGAILAVEGQKLDWRIYLSLLADRLDEMVKLEPDPQQAFKYLLWYLDSEDMLDVYPDNLEQAGTVILSNVAVQQALSEKDVPGELPKQLLEDDDEARQLVRDTHLEQWLLLLCLNPYNPDR